MKIDFTDGTTFGLIKTQTISYNRQNERGKLLRLLQKERDTVYRRTYKKGSEFHDAEIRVLRSTLAEIQRRVIEK
jgi:hypothetical protein